jgi:hypothetical protein
VIAVGCFTSDGMIQCTQVYSESAHLRVLPVTRLMVAATSSIAMYSPTTAVQSFETGDGNVTIAKPNNMHWRSVAES